MAVCNIDLFIDATQLACMLAFVSLHAELHHSHLGLQAFDRPLNRDLVIDWSLWPLQMQVVQHQHVSVSILMGATM